MADIITPNYLNFSWLIENKLAGHRGVQSAEHLQFLKDQGVTALVRMTEIPRVAKKEIEQAGLLDYHLHIPDMSAPAPEEINHVIEFIERCLSQDKVVGVSCDGGYGRTGTLLSCFLVTRGLGPGEAISLVKEKRPGSVLTDDQTNAVYTYAETRRHSRGGHHASP